MKRVISGSASESITTIPTTPLRVWNDAWLDPSFKDWNIEEVIDYLRIPALAIQGREDQYGTIAQIEALEAAAYSPVEVEVLDNCKHAPHLEFPERTASVVADFVARLDAIDRQTENVA